MSFAAQLANDLTAVFLNPAEFGETVTYFPRGQPSRSITAVVDRSLLQPRLGQSHKTVDEEIKLFCQADPVLGINDPQIGDALQLAEDAPDQLWDFDSRQPLSMGGITLRFKRSRLQRAGFAKADQL